MPSSFSLLLLSNFTFILLLLRPPPRLSSANPLPTNAARFRLHHRTEPLQLQVSDDTPPTTFFEVTKPFHLPNTAPCSYLLLQHDFAFTYGKPPANAPYAPPSEDCPSRVFDKIVLEWTATCTGGKQFDRVFGVWLGGVELLRSCTAEPRHTGVTWTVKKDITRYHSLLTSNKTTLTVYLGNLIDADHTGVYHVNVSMHFYPADQAAAPVGSDDRADLIMPISKNSSDSGLWFEIRNSTYVAFKEFTNPVNAYRAVLEVYVSFHENDEFWYTNSPDEYLSANNLTESDPGNGPFREVALSLDGMVIGAVWPFTVIYTGGVNPLMWRPITAIGSFDLPSYDVEITPFLGKLLDGKTHKFGFRVANGLNAWYVDANLHLWLDRKSKRTTGELFQHLESPLSVLALSNFTGLDGSFATNVSRSIASSGWVESSCGNITTRSVQGFGYSNTMVLVDNGTSETIIQTIALNRSVSTKASSSPPSLFRAIVDSRKKFTIDLRSVTIDKGNKTYESISNVTLGVEEKEYYSGIGVFTSELRNLQNANGYMVVNGRSVVHGLARTRQEYRYAASDKSCYDRDVSSSNYTVIHDQESNYTCTSLS